MNLFILNKINYLDGKLEEYSNLEHVKK